MAGGNGVTGKSGSEPNISVAQNNVSNATAQPADSSPEGNQDAKAGGKKTANTEKTGKKSKPADKNVVKTSTQGKPKNDGKDISKTADTKKGVQKPDNNKTVAVMSETGVKNKFDMEKGLLWPVSGDVILKFSMGNTVYFKTLAQYKCNPAVIIASEEGTKVKEAAGGTVTKVTHSDELGNMVTVDIGSGYTLTYGQLKDITVKEGQTVKEGDTIRKVRKKKRPLFQETD